MDFLLRNKRYRTLWAGVFLGGVIGWGAQARATVLAPGNLSVVTPGTASFTLLAPVTSESVPFSGRDVFNNEVFAGTMKSAVYLDPSGGLDFAYQVTATAGEPDFIHTLTVNSYATFTTDVDWVPGMGGTVTYATASRKITAAGNAVSFDYLASAASGIAPGATTNWILIKTNATRYDNLGVSNLIDGGGATINTYEPVLTGGSGAPEPMSLSLLLVGGTALLVRRSRRSIGRC